MQPRRTAVVVALVVLGCSPSSAAPSRPAHPRPLSPIEVDSALLPDDAVARARERLPDPLWVGVLYPPTDARPDGAYGILRSEPSLVRREGDAWLVAFSFQCPDDPTRGRVVRVDDDGSAQLLYPPVLLPSLEPAGLDDVTLAERGVRAVENPEHPEAVGEWFAAQQNGPLPFVYDDRTVRLLAIPMRAWEWRPEDFIWRLEASWAGDVLRVRYPTGGVGDFARFREGRFEDLPDGAVAGRPMALRTRRLSAGERGVELLRPRPAHDYELPLNTGPIVVRCSSGDCESNLRSPVRRLCND